MAQHPQTKKRRLSQFDTILISMSVAAAIAVALPYLVSLVREPVGTAFDEALSEIEQELVPPVSPLANVETWSQVDTEEFVDSDVLFRLAERGEFVQTVPSSINLGPTSQTGIELSFEIDDALDNGRWDYIPGQAERLEGRASIMVLGIPNNETTEDYTEQVALGDEIEVQFLSEGRLTYVVNAISERATANEIAPHSLTLVFMDELPTDNDIVLFATLVDPLEQSEIAGPTLREGDIGILPEEAGSVRLLDAFAAQELARLDLEAGDSLTYILTVMELQASGSTSLAVDELSFALVDASGRRFRAFRYLDWSTSDLMLPLTSGRIIPSGDSLVAALVFLVPDEPQNRYQLEVDTADDTETVALEFLVDPAR